MRILDGYDVVIVGAGPGGGTAATILAQHGRKVLVLEKERFPRYHIGESMLPWSYFILQRLGLLEKLAASQFPKKYSVQFARQDGTISQPFYFTKHRDHPSSQTWQVRRSEFDQMLADAARGAGAEIREGVRVTAILEEGGRTIGVRATDDEGPFEVRAPFTIDASGRDALSLGKHGWRVRDPKLNKVAIWTYFENAARDPGLDEGATTVAFLPGKGWFWYIPQPGNLTSVGVVAEYEYLYRDGLRDPEPILQREIPVNQWVAKRVAPGRVAAPYRVTGEYSYRGRHCAADGLVLVGDAFAFLDPVFSSGVYLALKSGELAADSIHAALAAGDVSASRFDHYATEMNDGIENMRRLVYTFYDRNFSFGKLFRAHPDLVGPFTDCLIGHVDADLDHLFSKVADFAELPERITHGRPFVKSA